MSLKTTDLYVFGPYRLNPAERRLLCDGKPVGLTPKAFDLLVLLVSRAGRLVTKEDALKEIWPDTFIEEGNLSYTISLLRKALGDDAEPHRYVETVPRRGYRFSAAVEVQDVVDAVVLPSVPEVPAPVRARRTWAYAAAAVVVLVLGLATTVTWLKRDGFKARSVSVPRAPVRLTMGGGLVTMPAISRDGTMVAYTAAAPGETNFDIWVQQIAGGGAVRLTTDALDDLNPAFSPDGATIAFQRSYLGIFLVPTLGGQPRLLVADGGIRPIFSPDGSWLAYTRVTGIALSEMLVVPVRGGPPTRVAKDLTWCDRSVWSPDGAHLLTSGHRERWPPFRNDWFLVPLDGGPSIETGVGAVLKQPPAQSPLGAENSALRFPQPQAWHADGDRIVFYARDGDTKNLWQVHFDRVVRRIVGTPERVTHGTDDEDQVSVSASGRMVYTSNDLRVDLWSVPLADDGVSSSGPLQQLTNDVADDFNPDLSPDGRLLAYASRRGGQFAVVVRDLATGKDREIGTTSEMPGPAFSPDGRQVAYAVRRHGGGPMFVAELATGSVEQVCDSCGVLTQWHKTKDLVIGSLWSQSGLTVFSLPDRRLRPLLRHEGLYLYVPSFSPDARWLTFSVQAEDSGFPSIVIAPVKGGVPAPRSEWVTVAERHQVGRWSARGDAIIFRSLCEGTPCICSQRLDARTKRPAGPRRETVRFPYPTFSSLDVEASNGLRVGVDRIVLGLSSRRGNLWMTDLPPARN